MIEIKIDYDVMWVKNYTELTPIEHEKLLENIDSETLLYNSTNGEDFYIEKPTRWNRKGDVWNFLYNLCHDCEVILT